MNTNNNINNNINNNGSSSSSMSRKVTPELEKEILRLEGSDAKAFLNYMKRERSADEKKSYKEADAFYKSKCKL